MLRWLGRHPFVIFILLVLAWAIYEVTPKRMGELARQEADLQQAFSAKMPIQSARSALQSRGLSFEEYPVRQRSSLYKSGSVELTGQPGETVIYSSSRVQAGGFPCKFDIRIILLFDSQQRLRDQLVNRWSLCM